MKLLNIIAIILFGGVFSIFSQGTISGKITTTDNEAIPFAFIYIIGTNNGTSSDADGIIQ